MWCVGVKRVLNVISNKAENVHISVICCSIGFTLIRHITGCQSQVHGRVFKAALFGSQRSVLKCYVPGLCSSPYSGPPTEHMLYKLPAHVTYTVIR